MRKNTEYRNFVDKFLHTFRNYIRSNGENLSDYSWMIYNSNKMQNQLGVQGIASRFRPAYENIVYQNYPLIINLIPEINRLIKDYTLKRIAYQYCELLEDALGRHMGNLNNSYELYIKDLKNPLKWLREGVREIVSIPAYLLNWLGIINESSTLKITSSVFFNIFSGIVALITILSTLMAVVVGWDKFIEKLKSLL